MNSYRKACFAVFAAIILSLLFCMPVVAQGPADLTAQNQATTAPLPDAPQKAASADPDDSWRFAVSIYGWFPGIHGTVGALGHNAGIHESFSDVFHYLKGVIPIAFEADKGRFVMPLDFFWVKLGDDRGIPLNDLEQTSVNLHIYGIDLYPEGRIQDCGWRAFQDRCPGRNPLLVRKPERHPGAFRHWQLAIRQLGGWAWAARGSYCLSRRRRRSMSRVTQAEAERIWTTR